MKRSTNSKLVVGYNEVKNKQSMVNKMTVKEQRRRESIKQKKAKRWTKWVEPYYLYGTKPKWPKRHAAWQPASIDVTHH